MKRKFRNGIFGLFLALCCVFALTSYNFMGVKVSATEGETQETQEEVKEPENLDKTYSFVSEGEGAGTVTLHEDGSFKAIVFFVSTQETLEGEGTYTIEGDLLTLTITDTQFVFIINNETMTLEEYKVIEPPVEEQPEQEVVPEPEPETPEVDVEEEVKGFFEKNLETIVSSAMGVFAAIATFFALVFKAGKSVKDTLEAFKGGKITQEEAIEEVKKAITTLKEEKEKMVDEVKTILSEAKKNLQSTQIQMEELTKYFNQILGDYKRQLDNMTENFKKVCDSIVLMANNNASLVKNGVAEIINEKLNGGEVNAKTKEK